MRNAAGGPAPIHVRAGRVIRKRWRAWLRAIHRDVGYLVVGLTFIYAISGLAINHIDDWNPNFETVENRYTIELPLPTTDETAAAEHVVSTLGIDGVVSYAYLVPGEQLDVELEGTNHALRVDLRTGDVFEDVEEPRFFLRVANWLHYNRGKAAWTYIADGYAILLLYLALSGLFMLRGRKGLIGRGAILVAIGAAVPIAYVQFSGGP